MPLANAKGKQIEAMRAEMDELSNLPEASDEQLQKALELHKQLESAEAEYKGLRAVDDANEARKAADKAVEDEARQKALQPTTRPNLSLVKSDTQAVQKYQRLSDVLVKSDQWQAAHKMGHQIGMQYSVNADDFEFKAAGDPILSTTFGTRFTSLQIPPHSFPLTNVYPLIPVQTLSTGFVRIFVPTDPMGGAAAGVAEGTAKPEVQPRWTTGDYPIETIADWTAVTLQALDDIPQLRAAIDFDLSRAVEVAWDNLLLNGSGTSPQIRGILNVAGIQTVAFVASTSIADSIAKGINAVLNSGYGRPNAVIMNPNDYWAMRSTANGLGFYYFGAPTEVGTPMLWGLDVVTSTAIAAGTALVGDFSFATWWQRQGITFIVGLKNDDLIKNMITIVCEMRGALTVSKPKAFAKVALV